MYTDIDEGFVKTKIPVKEACINGEPVEILDTFAARELQQSGHSSAPDDVMDYMQRTDCNFDTLRKINRRKNHHTLFIV